MQNRTLSQNEPKAASKANRRLAAARLLLWPLAFMAVAFVGKAEEVFSTNVGGYYTLHAPRGTQMLFANQFPGNMTVAQLFPPAGMPNGATLAFSGYTFTRGALPFWQASPPAALSATLPIGQEFQVSAGAVADFTGVIAGVLEEGVYEREIIGGPGIKLQCSVLPLSGHPEGGLGFSLLKGGTVITQYFSSGVRPVFSLSILPMMEIWQVNPAGTPTPPSIKVGESFFLNLDVQAGDRSLRQELVISEDSLAVTVE